MHAWIITAILAYFFFAAAAVVDKFILTKKIDRPAVYTVLVSLLGVLVLAIAPILPGELFVLPPSGLAWSFAYGVAFVFAIFYLYRAMRLGEASRVVPIIISFQPIFILLMAWVLIGETLAPISFLAFLLILFGAVLISYQKSTWQVNRKIFAFSLLAAFFFALNLAGSKFLFDQYGFASPFVWIRIGSVVAAGFFLLSRSIRQGVWQMIKPKPAGHHQKHGLLLVIVAQAFGAVGVVMVNYAVSIGPVSLVGALQGLQHMFVFVLTTLISLMLPRVLSEKISRSILIQKSIAIIILVSGVAILALSSTG
ncbi:MAG: hypothetical protein COT81_00235 [Candidatus Buchananbacteria bacterium CG10_big_fil_rev_8_21_14_0_10_42_9]|uniref:EamA domain-containing protein n=1 Tax=Candidatus Buchananbacteria bacterium CG10_big_fil_rev_8_21_14_0_10_42_9 TaxID=1974526 RepID=A0A2H0W2L3_9BACT|nr:MAG: hypothetical protein COT81_00235 [Candidatus Buchananbacteria bacterium CG10_big_fil_rev_8_21_14_0_10_42_9]